MIKGEEECWQGSCGKPVVASIKVRFKDRKLGVKGMEFNGCVEHFAYNWGKDLLSIRDFTERGIEDYTEVKNP